MKKKLVIIGPVALLLLVGVAYMMFLKPTPPPTAIPIFIGNMDMDMTRALQSLPVM